jgi:hypothetical protein
MSKTTPELSLADLENKTPDELRRLTAALQEEQQRVAKEQEQNDALIKQKNEFVRANVPNVSEVQTVAKKRAETLDRKLRLEKKVLSLYARFRQSSKRSSRSLFRRTLGFLIGSCPWCASGLSLLSGISKSGPRGGTSFSRSLRTRRRCGVARAI